MVSDSDSIVYPLPSKPSVWNLLSRKLASLSLLVTLVFVIVLLVSVQRTEMGYDIARFEGEIDEELLCPICSGVLEDPVQVSECQVERYTIGTTFPFSGLK